jgi:transposase-like protein
VLVELSVMEQRYQAVMAVIQDGWKVSEVAERIGVSRQAIHKWIARYEQGGLPALADRSHKPQSCEHQITPELETLICELRRQHPGWGPRRILHQLGRDDLNAFAEDAYARTHAPRRHWSCETVRHASSWAEVDHVRQLPNFGEPFDSREEASYITDRGTEVWMYRSNQKVRFYDRSANQIGPEHSNVYPATVWVFQHGWYSPTSPQWLNDGCFAVGSSEKTSAD